MISGICQKSQSPNLSCRHPEAEIIEKASERKAEQHLPISINEWANFQLLE